MSRIPNAAAGRPRHALEGHEDEVYHDQPVARQTEPEYSAFLGRSWVFNRATRWLEAPGNTLICFSEAGDLALTGREAVSEWFSDPVNGIAHDAGGTTLFTRRSGRNRDCAVLPGLQFSVDQYGRATLNVEEATCTWQPCVLVKGRSGPPLLAGEWQDGPGSLELDIAGELAARGYTVSHHELHFAIGLWTDSPEEEDCIRFRWTLRGRPAVVPCLPVIRTSEEAGDEGVPVSAVVLDASGKVLGSDRVKLVASCGAARIELVEADGLWSGSFAGIPEGEHRVRLTPSGAVEAESTLAVRVTGGEFIDYDPQARTMTLFGKPLGPVTGSYQGLVLFRDAGGEQEGMVNGQEAFDGWDRSRPPGEHWHYWEALTEAELDERFRYLAENGWDLLHLCQHWGLWEKLDAGGRIAPHGAEQVALYYRVAARHGLRVVQALSHYAYGAPAAADLQDGRVEEAAGAAQGSTLPYRSTIEAGYSDRDWIDSGSSFTETFHGYLRDYARMFRSETAVAWLTASGEGDIAAGPARVNDTMECIASEDPNHLFLSEPIHSLQVLPENHVKGWWAPQWIIERWKRRGVELDPSGQWNQPLYGSRLYWIGRELEPDLDLGIEYRLMRTGRTFVGEGSWPCPDLYARVSGIKRNWCGTREYRTRVRDSLYLGLVHRIPAILTWEEQLTEDERRVLREVREGVDWSQRWHVPPVAVLVDDSCVRERRNVLAGIEAALTATGLEAVYVTPGNRPPAGTLEVLDAREDAPPLAEWVGARELPPALEQRALLRASAGYRVSSCISDDQRTLLAYVCNVSHYEEIDHSRSLGGSFHRLPEEAALKLELRGLPKTPLTLAVYDLERRRRCIEKEIRSLRDLDLGATRADYCVLVRPR